MTDVGEAKHLDSIQEASLALMTSLDALRSGTTTNECTFVFSYTEKDLILYSLGVGASVTKPEEFKFLYENHKDFSPLPTFFAVPAYKAVYMSNTIENAVPGKRINVENILHGEQYLETVGDVQSATKLISKLNIAEVLDKGSGALLVYNIDSYDENGRLLVKNQVGLFAVGTGKFGGPRTGTKLVACVNKPSRNPDATLQQITGADQAALYRLSGDRHPLHIDPNIATRAGFNQPILHGLCSLGYSVRLILRAFADSDASLFKAVKARFVKPVVPGQTLKVDMWRDGNRIFFETSVAETNTTVIAGAYVDLKSIKVSNQPQPVSSSPTMNLQSDAIFDFIIDRVNAEPAKAKTINGVFLYNITKDGKQVKQWTMDLKNASIYSGPPNGVKPNTTLTISDEDFVELAAGKLNPQQAFMKGKLKITGNIMLAQKLGPILKAEAQL